MANNKSAKTIIKHSNLNDKNSIVQKLSMNFCLVFSLYLFLTKFSIRRSFHQFVALEVNHSSMQQIFSTLSPQQLNIVTQHSLPFIMHNFSRYLTYGTTESCFLAMNNSHIYVYESQNTIVPVLQTPLQFTLKFDIIRQEWKDQLTPGKAIGITLQKDNCQSISFYSNSQAIVQAWRIKLEQKINQRGFHKLFKAKRKIGKGAFATVYLAERLQDKKLVAVKAFSKERQYSSQKGRDSLINEIKLMRKLRNHNNLINLEGIFQTQNSIYVILENLEGGQLHQKIKSGTKFTLYEASQIMSSILKGLAVMDSNRIIHRDLKPQNMLFRSKDSLDLVIADFGLATWAQQPTYLFVRCGTPGFVAPEIINIKDMATHSDPVSDIFSAGLILHYLLLGKSVFKGSKYAQILTQNRACDFKLVGPQYEEIDRNAYDLLCKMLQVNPKLRIKAHQALNHKLFKQCMELQECKQPLYNNCLIQFNKQTKIKSIYDSPYTSTSQNKQNLLKTPRKIPNEYKKKKENLHLKNNNMQMQIDNNS